jgi:hypothetical protein
MGFDLSGKLRRARTAVAPRLGVMPLLWTTKWPFRRVSFLLVSHITWSLL